MNDGVKYYPCFWMPGSMGTPGLQTGRAAFIIHPEKGSLGVWTDAWVR